MKPVRAHTLQNRHTKSSLSHAKPNVLKVHPSNGEEHTRSIRQKCIKLIAFYTNRSRGWTWQHAIKDTTWQGPIAFTFILKCHASNNDPQAEPMLFLRLPGAFRCSTCLQPCGTRRQTHIFQHDGTNCHHWRVWAFAGWIFCGCSGNYRISPNLNKVNNLSSEVRLIWAMN